ncbi:hypothetical protein CC2G_011549 [Coprinopsis cinerea AmutBmut pab1-1]|nr:hypothetical protein CC2G_011549 [Coprinopsis cinerea AmutBmut pab1-1]
MRIHKLPRAVFAVWKATPLAFHVPTTSISPPALPRRTLKQPSNGWFLFTSALDKNDPNFVLTFFDPSATLDIACVGRFHGVQAIKEFVDWALGSVVSGDTTAKAVEFTPTGLKVATEGTRTFKNGESKAFNSFVTTITKDSKLKSVSIDGDASAFIASCIRNGGPMPTAPRVLS